MPRRITLPLSGSLTMDEARSVVNLVRPVIDACATPTEFELTVDMNDLTFITPSCLALLTATVLHGFRHDCCLGGAVKASRVGTVDEYLKRMDFYRLLDVPVKTSWRRYDAVGRFMELTEVATDEEAESVVRDLTAIFREQTEMTRGVVSIVEWALAELLENVFHHADSPVNAVVCAQSYPALEEIEFAIVDTGVGFRESLGRNPELRARCTTAGAALEAAVELGTTGRPDHNSGSGLFFTREAVKANGGRMLILSEDAGVFVEQGGQHTRPLSSPWQGAVVAVRLHTDRRVSTKDIFDQYAPPENDFQIRL